MAASLWERREAVAERMACCGLVIYLLAKLLRVGRGDPRVPAELSRVRLVGASDGRVRLPSLLVGALVELGVAVGLAAVVVRLAGHGDHHHLAMAGESHLMFMVRVELLMVVIPVVLVWGAPRGWRDRRGPRWLLLVAPLAWVTVLIAWHLPGLHSATGVEPLRTVSLLAAGVALWWCVFVGDTATEVERRAADRSLIVVLEASALIGLALLVAPAPLYSHAATGWPGLPALADQRAAGALMMIVEIAVAAIWWRRRALSRPAGNDVRPGTASGIVRRSTA